MSDERAKAFTIMEVMVVIILVGVIAAFGIPSYNKALEKSDEREAVNNLRLIADAMEIYRVRQEAYPPANMPQATDINATLNLGIIERNIDYTCLPSGPDVRCRAISNYGWDLDYTTPAAIGNDVQCNSGGCPSCAAVNCSYAGLF